VPVGGQTLSETEIKDWLRQDLPEYMIPRRFIQMSSLPLQENGKLDIATLQETVRDVGLLADSQKQNSVEAALILLWRSVLRVDSVGLNDNFFELGGDSLLATQVAGLLQETTQSSIPIIHTFFDNATVKNLSKVLLNEMDEVSALTGVRQANTLAQQHLQV
jgi:acyl carrier protein